MPKGFHDKSNEKIKNMPFGAEGAKNEKSAPKAPKNEKIGAEGAEKGRGWGARGLSTVVCPFVMTVMILSYIIGNNWGLCKIIGN